jgi:hypothetical protein
MKDYSRKEARLYAADARAALESVPAYNGQVEGMLSRQAASHYRQGNVTVARALTLESRRASRIAEFA